MNNIERSLSPSEPILSLPSSQVASASTDEVIEQVAVINDAKGQDTFNDDVLNNEQEAATMPEPGDQETQEARAAKAQPAPYTPSPEEIANHNMTHIPYRSWCPQCVRGKGKASPHRHYGAHHEAGVPVVSIDYKYLCDS